MGFVWTKSSSRKERLRSRSKKRGRSGNIVGKANSTFKRRFLFSIFVSARFEIFLFRFYLLIHADSSSGQIALHITHLFCQPFHSCCHSLGCLSQPWIRRTKLFCWLTTTTRLRLKESFENCFPAVCSHGFTQRINVRKHFEGDVVGVLFKEKMAN